MCMYYDEISVHQIYTFLVILDKLAGKQLRNSGAICGGGDKGSICRPPYNFQMPILGRSLGMLMADGN